MKTSLSYLIIKTDVRTAGAQPRFVESVNNVQQYSSKTIGYPNVYGLYVGRFVGGLSVGAFSVGIPPYVEDISEKQLLPTLANFYHVHLACGVLFGYVVGKDKIFYI
ncbi:unnamed protein product [Diatraea saccharalis]|uniref:Major facilitator superfamily (MFS) profile domain-containing protein n=1 Tax=Diatraea saccharalis TaxID=40085 RepID=A0A9N9RE32_9NEOP|nr:unnamed protein product [Diatraea saccharalis]